MTDKLKSDYLLGGLLVLVAARSGNWLLSSHPEATTLDLVLTWAQVIVCLVAGIRLIRRSQGSVTPS